MGGKNSLLLLEGGWVDGKDSLLLLIAVLVGVRACIMRTEGLHYPTKKERERL